MVYSDRMVIFERAVGKSLGKKDQTVLLCLMRMSNSLPELLTGLALLLDPVMPLNLPTGISLRASEVSIAWV